MKIIITMAEYFTALLNGIEPLNFLTAFTFGIFGMVLMFTIKYEKHGKHDPATPQKFSWRFWFVDNTIRLFRNVSVIIAFILFSQPLAGVALSSAFAFGVGLGLEKAIKILRNFGSTNLDKKD